MPGSGLTQCSGSNGGEVGVLVLFPSYMWHGVEPFESDRARLTVAFDALPA